jgi:hypothetical protein
MERELDQLKAKASGASAKDLATQAAMICSF